MANSMSMYNIIILCGHYKGVDQRFAIISLQKKSLGDYVLVNWGVVRRFNPIDSGVLSDETSHDR
jgi:tRNA G37 N-methylase TrmD